MDKSDKMGEIRVNVHLENPLDMVRGQGREIRTCDVEAVVDTGALMLFLPQDVVEVLGLPLRRRATVRYADESRDVRDVAGPVTVEILGRAMDADCIVGPPGSEALVGQLEIERLDLVADCQERKVYPREDSPYPTLKIKFYTSR